MYGETKQGRMRRLAGLGAVALAAVAVTGCAHNDVLVFGTSTTIGLNVESVSAEGAPSIVLGYEREEAVWMPLVLNGNDSKLSLCAGDGAEVERCTRGSVPVSQAMYRSEIEEADGRVTRDTYSVFASLGARFSGNAGRDNVGAGGGLAQFFATGNAAVNISQNQALVTALKVESEGGADAQARAVGAAAGNETADSAFAGLTPDQIATITAAAERERNQQLRRADQVVACAMAADGTFRWGAIVDGLNVSTYPPSTKTNLKLINTREALRSRLENNQFLTSDALAVGAAAPFNCPGA